MRAVLGHRGTPHRKKTIQFNIRWTGRETEERRRGKRKGEGGEKEEKERKRGE